MNSKPIVVGIDPGITTAYAVIDLEGNIIQLNSSKELDLNRLVSETFSLGKPILIGTDKAKIPHLIDSYSAKTGARIINPSEDLKVDEKKDATKNLNFGDNHQMDALASALFVLRSVRPLIEKIDKILDENKKVFLKDKVKALVLRKQISIKSAIEIVEAKMQPKKIVEPITIKPITPNNNPNIKLYDTINRQQAEIKILKNYNNKLNNLINNNSKNKTTKTDPIKETNIQTKDFREKRIKNLENLLKSRDKVISKLSSRIFTLSKVINNINDYYVLKKLDSLGYDELTTKNNLFGIKQNDILFVRNPSEISESTVDFLKDKVFVIATLETKANQAKLPFVFLNIKDINYIEEKHFIFIDKKQFDEIKRISGWAKKIIEEYKSEKSQVRHVINS